MQSFSYTCDECFSKFTRGEIELSHYWEGITSRPRRTLSLYCCAPYAVQCEEGQLFRYRRPSPKDTTLSRKRRPSTSNKILLQGRRSASSQHRLEGSTLQCSEEEVDPSCSDCDSYSRTSSSSDEGFDGNEPGIYDESSSESESFSTGSLKDTSIRDYSKDFPWGPTRRTQVELSSATRPHLLQADREMDQFELFLSDEDPQATAIMDSWKYWPWQEPFNLEIDEILPRLRNT